MSGRDGESEFEHFEIGPFQSLRLPPNERPWKQLAGSELEMNRIRADAASASLQSRSDSTLSIQSPGRLNNPILIPERGMGSSSLRQQAQDILTSVQQELSVHGQTRFEVAQREQERVMEALLPALPIQSTRSVVQEVLNLVGASDGAVKKYLVDHLPFAKPFLEPRLLDKRIRNAVRDRLALIERQPIDPVDKGHAQRVILYYQHVELLIGTGQFATLASDGLFTDARRGPLQAVDRLVDQLRNSGYGALTEAAVLYIVTAHPLTVVRDDATC